jgi:hypothetical protein
VRLKHGDRTVPSPYAVLSATEVFTMPQPLTKAEFLKLSSNLCDDCRTWLNEVEAHHALTIDELEMLAKAIEIIDRTTVKLTVE